MMRFRASYFIMLACSLLFPALSKPPFASVQSIMLRAAVSTGLCQRGLVVRANKTTFLRPTASFRLTNPSQLAASVRPTLGANARWLASSSNQEPPKQEKKSKEGDDDTTSEIVLTPGEKVVAASRLTMWAGIAVFAAACAYYIGKELIPTKMSPNRVFDKAFEVVRQDPQIKQRFGDSLKAYGRDHGGHREGRRNFVE
jgi:hypothetical protein